MNNKIRAGLKRLFIDDDHLLKENINERSITHRLAMYYQEHFPDWHVDCEYNRNLKLPKGVDLDVRLLLDRMADILSWSIDGLGSTRHLFNSDDISFEERLFLRDQLLDPERLKKTEEDIIYFLLSPRRGNDIQKPVYPDIIVHKRGTKKNYIVIEAKKSTNTDRLSRAYDLLKLFAFITDSNYQYKRGYFIDLPCGDDYSKHRLFNFERQRFEPKLFIVDSRP